MGKYANVVCKVWFLNSTGCRTKEAENVFLAHSWECRGFRLCGLCKVQFLFYHLPLPDITPPIYPWSIKGKLGSTKNPRMKVHTIKYLKIEWFALWSILLKTIRSIKSSFCYHRRPSFFPKMQVRLWRLWNATCPLVFLYVLLQPTARQWTIIRRVKGSDLDHRRNSLV